LGATTSRPQLAGEFYFASGSAHGPRSSIWRAWNPVGKDDIYVAPEYLSEAFKVSLHQSGQLQVGFAKGFVQPGKPGALMGYSPKNRLLRKWIAAEIHPRAHLLFRLGLPQDEARARPCPPTSAARTQFIPAAPQGHMLELGFFLVAPNVETVASGPNVLLWNHQLRSGRSLSILMNVQRYESGLKTQVEQARKRIGTATASETLRLIIGGATPDDVHFFLDAAL